MMVTLNARSSFLMIASESSSWDLLLCAQHISSLVNTYVRTDSKCRSHTWRGRMSIPHHSINGVFVHVMRHTRNLARRHQWLTDDNHKMHPPVGRPLAGIHLRFLLMAVGIRRSRPTQTFARNAVMFDCHLRSSIQSPDMISFCHCTPIIRSSSQPLSQ